MNTQITDKSEHNGRVALFVTLLLLVINFAVKSVFVRQTNTLCTVFPVGVEVAPRKLERSPTTTRPKVFRNAQHFLRQLHLTVSQNWISALLAVFLGGGDITA